MLAELDKVTKAGPKSYAVIKDAEEVITGIDNVSFTVWGYADAQDETGVTPVTDNKNMSYGTYALYDDDNYVIAAVVVGVSDGVAQTIAYVHTDDLEDEGYDRSTGMWTWTRNVIISGEEVLLTETDDDDTESVLENLVEGGWYTIKYDADGNVKGADRFNADDDEYVTSLKDAVTTLRTEDLVIVDIVSQIRLAYSTSGRTLWNSESTQDNGIRVASDVKVVVKQTNDRKTTTDYYDGYDALVSALEDLNEKDSKNKYYFGAVIEDGRATSIIIVDDYSDDDVTGPGGKPIVGDAYDVASVNRATRTIYLDKSQNTGSFDNDKAYAAAQLALYDLGWEVTSTELNTGTSPYSVKAVNMDSSNTTELTWYIQWEA